MNNAIRIHGHTTHTSRSTTYYSWANMKARCLNANHNSYATYGARGITVCERWMTFENFLADMGKKPLGTSLGRINNKEGYGPSNCRWETSAEQQRNTRRTLLIAIGGVTKCVTDWAKDFGVDRHNVYHRIAAGWEPVRAVTTPDKKKQGISI